MSNQKLANGQFLRITELYAFVAKDENGHEGIMAFQTPEGVYMPLIGADIERVHYLKPLADKVAAQSGKQYEIRYFTQKLPA